MKNILFTILVTLGIAASAQAAQPAFNTSQMVTTGSTTSGGIPFINGTHLNSSSNLVFASSTGFVGIRKSDPQVPLDINVPIAGGDAVRLHETGNPDYGSLFMGGAEFHLDLYDENHDAAACPSGYDNGGQCNGIQMNINGENEYFVNGNASYADHHFYINNVGKFRITNSGKTMAGTSTTETSFEPPRQFNVYGDSYFYDKAGFGTTTPWRMLSVNGSSDLGVNALAGSFTATSSTATSTFAGAVGVGTSSPISKFAVQGISNMFASNVGNTSMGILTLQAGASTRNGSNAEKSTNALLLKASPDGTNPKILTIGTATFAGSSNGNDTLGQIDYLGRWEANPGNFANFGPSWIDATMQAGTRCAACTDLILRGSSGQSSDMLEVQDNGGTPLLTIDSAGNLGIGTSPSKALDVAGSGNLTGNLNVGGLFTQNQIYSDSGGHLITVGDIDDNFYGNELTVQGETHTAFLYSDDTSSMLGINTFTPSHALDVVGDANVTGCYMVNGSCVNESVETASISGAITGIGCDTADTSGLSSLASSTAFVTTPETFPGNGVFFYSMARNSTTMRTYVCSDVTVTPNASKYIVKIIR